MKHFYQDIEGKFDFEDVYTAAVRRAPFRSHLLEIGCWQGKSTAFLAAEAIRSKKELNIHVIDDFSFLHGKFESREQLREKFLSNIAPVKDIITLHEQKSDSVPSALTDIQFSFIYIDGGHAHETVSQDISVWYPKLRQGGVISGHDYSRRFPSVRIAVAEHFGFSFSTMLNSWYHIKSVEPRP